MAVDIGVGVKVIVFVRVGEGVEEKVGVRSEEVGVGETVSVSVGVAEGLGGETGLLPLLAQAPITEARIAKTKINIQRFLLNIEAPKTDPFSTIDFPLLHSTARNTAPQQLCLHYWPAMINKQLG